MKKHYSLFGLFCCMIYFTSYISRINFGAILAEIIASEGIAKSSISVVIVMSSISYGIGQPISGVLGDKLPPAKLILTGLLITGISNLLIPFCSSTSMMSAIWFANGFAQAFMWPPLVKLMSTHLDGNQFSQTSANVSTASSIGTIFVYLTAPLFIRLSSWRSVFWFSGTAAIIVAIIWNTFLPKITRHLPVIISTKYEQEQQDARDSMWTTFKKYGLILICISIIAQGALRDGITTWMPTCLTEVFDMEAAISILISVVLPICSIFSFQLSAVIQRKWIKNEIQLAAYMYILCAIFIAIWGLLYSYSVILSVLLPAMIIALIHGINLMLICVVPRRFAGCGHISFISGLLNSCTYVGSAISTYGIAKISELAGWQVTIWTWGGAAIIGFIMCIICIPKFRTKRKA